MAKSTRGLGSNSMDESKKREIQSKGGKATGGKNLTREARIKGGKNSRGGGRKSASSSRSNSSTSTKAKRSNESGYIRVL